MTESITAELLVDEHAIVLDEVADRVRRLLDDLDSGRWPSPALGRLLDFLHYELLDQAAQEERLLFPLAGGSGDARIRSLQADHAELRVMTEELADLAVAQTPDSDRLVTVAGELERLLDGHVVREERALAAVTLDGVGVREQPAWRRGWYRLLEGPVLDLDALPPQSVAEAVGRRVARLAAGESVQVRSSRAGAAARAARRCCAARGLLCTQLTARPGEDSMLITRRPAD